MHSLCNNYWLDTDSEQGCDLPIIKDATYGFNQNADVVATLSPSPLDNFCASAKHNSSPNTYSIDSAAAMFPTSNCTEYAEPDDCFKIFMYDAQKEGVPISEKYPGAETIRFRGHGHDLISGQTCQTCSKEQRMRNLMKRDNWNFLGECRGFVLINIKGEVVDPNTRIWGHAKYLARGNERRGMFLTAADLESARHQTYKTRQRMTQECINQQSKCVAIKIGRGPGQGRNPQMWAADSEEMGCPELLSTSCVIEPVGILNAPGYNCGTWDDGPDCSEKIIPTAEMCSRINNAEPYAVTPGCKGFVDREIFEENCHRGRMGSNWKEIWKADIEKLGLEAMTSHVSARIRACSSYVAGMPEMTNQFE